MLKTSKVRVSAQTICHNHKQVQEVSASHLIVRGAENVLTMEFVSFPQ